jgi:N-acetyl-anhydromuramyl-L-alanine amidase AmpD
MAWDDNITPSLVGNYARTASAAAKPYSGIIMHVTGKQTLADELNWMKTNKQGLGYHYIIDRDGKVYQTAPLDRRMNQALPDVDKSYNNNNSLGIAMVAGGTPGEEPPPFTPAQLATGRTLVDGLRGQYNIPADRVVGHGQIQTDREAGNKLNAGGGYEAQDFINYYSKGAQPNAASSATPQGTTVNTTSGQSTQPANAVGDTRQFLFNKLTGELGLQPKVALGVLYGLAGESGGSLDPTSYNPNDPGGSFGFANWNGPRRVALDTMARHMGLSSGDPNAQWAYMKAELTGQPGAVSYSNVLDSLKKANTTEDATRIWTGDYEAPKVNNWQQRLGQAPFVGSVDDKGNFVPGSAKGAAVASAPGTTINTVPAGALPAGGNLDQIIAGLGKLSGGGKGKDSGGGDQSSSDQSQAAPMALMRDARNTSPLGGAMLPASSQLQAQITGYQPQPYGHTLTSIADPTQWGSQPPGQAPYAATGQQAPPEASPYGTSLAGLQMAYGLSPQQLQMLMNQGGSFG